MARGPVKSAWVNSPQADEVAKYYVEGHTVTDTAKHFGVSKHQVNNLVKKRRLTNGKTWGSGSAEQIERLRAEGETRIINRLDSIGFDYVGGYTCKTGKVMIRCRECGYEFERSVDFAKNGNVICQKCEHERVLIRQAERREQQKIESVKRQTIRKAEKIKNNPLGLSCYQLSRIKTIDNVHVCKECGKEYTLREYMESTGIKYYRNSGYCSAECRKKALNRSVHESRKRRGVPENHRQRARKYGCAYDPSVTLKKLIKRDGLRCAICGEMCDLSDRGYSKYSGPMYPSIDHIVPMSKGGGHVWNNVQVAHIICNSEKGDNTQEAV